MADTKQIILGAYDEALKLIDEIADELANDPSFIQRVAEQRYKLKHRGRPMAIAAFAARKVPAGKNPLEAAHQYETEMEKSILKRKRKGGTR